MDSDNYGAARNSYMVAGLTPGLVWLLPQGALSLTCVLNFIHTLSPLLALLLQWWAKGKVPFKWVSGVSLVKLWTPSWPSWFRAYTKTCEISPIPTRNCVQTVSLCEWDSNHCLPSFTIKWVPWAKVMLYGIPWQCIRYSVNSRMVPEI